MRNSTIRNSINATFWNGITDVIIKSLTTGTLLTAYAVYFGMGNILLGFLQAVVPFSNLLHLIVSYFLEKGKSPKKIACISSLLSRPFLVILALSFFFRESSWGVFLFSFSYALFYIMVGITGGAFWPWCKVIVPKLVSISFFARRIRFILLTKVLIVTTATVLLSFIKANNSSKDFFIYPLFLFLAFIIGLFYTYTLYRMQDVRLQNDAQNCFLKKIQLAFKNKEFLKLFFNISFMNFTLAFFTPFSIVFLLKDLGLSISTTLCFSIGSSCVDILFIGFWKKYAYKKNLAAIMLGATFFFVAAIMCLIYISVYKMNIYPFLVIAFILIGIGNSGINLAISDASITYVPRKMSSVYISLMNIGRFSFSGMGSFLAGLIIEVLGFYTSYQWTFFLISCGVFFIFSGLSCRTVKSVKNSSVY